MSTSLTQSPGHFVIEGNTGFRDQDMDMSGDHYLVDHTWKGVLVPDLSLTGRVEGYSDRLEEKVQGHSEMQAASRPPAPPRIWLWREWGTDFLVALDRSRSRGASDLGESRGWPRNTRTPHRVASP